MVFFFFFKQKTAYDMRISDWSSDVCSSDLAHPDHVFGAGAFAADDPVFIGHEKLPAALARNGQYYQQRLEEILGPGQAGPVVMPTRTVANQAERAEARSVGKACGSKVRSRWSQTH